MSDPLYQIAREITDEFFGPGAYAEVNGLNHSDPQVRQQAQISRKATMESDSIFDEMVQELHDALVGAGLDPANPPTETKPPSEKVWGEYLRRGGNPDAYSSPDEFTDKLVSAVARIP